MKKRGKLIRERASAMLFSLPGKCDRRMVKLCWAATRNRVRSSRMSQDVSQAVLPMPGQWGGCRNGSGCVGLPRDDSMC